jgi:hypothetical protein
METSSKSLPVRETPDGMLEFIADTDVVSILPGCKLVRREKRGGSWDGASIPKPLWNIIGHPFDEKFILASYWHDRMCEDAVTHLDRYLADLIFLYFLYDAKVPLWKCLVMWYACRIWPLLRCINYVYVWLSSRLYYLKEKIKGVEELQK